MVNMTCCFFGHKDVTRDLSEDLTAVLTKLIAEGVDSFLVGNQGNFDNIVLHTLRQMKKNYRHITYHVVLAYMPGSKKDWFPYEAMETYYPEGLETVHPRFAISWRNRWMIKESDVVVTYITHSWGGAAQFVELAERMHKRVINVASLMTPEMK